MLRSLLLLVVTLTAWSFQEPPEKTRAQLVEEEIERRLEKSRGGFEERCRRDVLERATVVADSLMLERAYLLRDTTGRPARPNRPVKPEAMRPRDSFAVKPILVDTLRE